MRDRGFTVTKLDVTTGGFEFYEILCGNQTMNDYIFHPEDGSWTDINSFPITTDEILADPVFQSCTSSPSDTAS